MSTIPPNGNVSSSYRPDVDGLRAIAVLAVVLFHAFPSALPGGFIGVDIFFVISGFLISKIIHSDLEKSSFSIAKFYSRRIRRIFPALLVVLVATTAMGWFIQFPNEFRQLGKHLAGCAAFLSNILLWDESGYFDVASETKPLLHLWSLAVEEQFYFVWPLLMALVWRLRWNFKMVTATLLAVSFAVNLYQVANDPGAAYFLPFSRFWELLAGAMLAHLVRANRIIPSRLVQPASSLGIAALVLGFVLIDSSSAFPGWWAILPILGAFLLLWAGEKGWWNTHLLSRRPVVWIGLISYPLYLWHWPIFSFLRIHAGETMPGVPVRIAAIALAFLLAYLTYRLVEGPIRHNPSRKVVPFLLTGLGVMAAAGVSMFFRAIPPRLNAPELTEIIQASSEWTFPGRLVPKQGFLGAYEMPPRGKPTTLFIGDSHLGQYFVRIGEFVATNPDRANDVLAITHGGCPPIPDVHNPDDPGCNAMVGKMYETADSPEIHAVVVGGCWNCFFEDVLVGKPTDKNLRIAQDGEKRILASEQGWKLTLAKLQERLARIKESKRVYLLLDNPRGPEFDPWSRVGTNRLGDFAILPPKDSAPVDPVELRIRADLQAMATRIGIETLDPRSMLCSETKCLASSPDGRSLYKDDNHVRGFFVQTQATFIDRAMLP
jgi:peptidoglycan/LPS O-acetylase OafA/YrhL